MNTSNPVASLPDSALLSVSRCVYYVGDSPAPLFELAKRFKIDPAKIKKELAAEAKAKAKPAKK